MLKILSAIIFLLTMAPAFSASEYRFEEGDTLETIAQKQIGESTHHICLRRSNGISDEGQVNTDQRLVIPDRSYCELRAKLSTLEPNQKYPELTLSTVDSSIYMLRKTNGDLVIFNGVSYRSVPIDWLIKHHQGQNLRTAKPINSELSLNGELLHRLLPKDPRIEAAGLK